MHSSIIFPFKYWEPTTSNIIPKSVYLKCQNKIYFHQKQLFQNSVWSHFPKQTLWRNFHVSQNLSNFTPTCKNVGLLKRVFKWEHSRCSSKHKICLFGFDRTPNQPLLQEKLVWLMDEFHSFLNSQRKSHGKISTTFTYKYFRGKFLFT